MVKTLPKRVSLAQRLQQAIGWGLVVLLAIMPFHAFLSVWLGSIFGHEAIFQAWKEVLLLALGLASIWLLFIDRAARTRLKNPLVWAIVALIAVALVVTALDRPGLTAIAFGAKTDLEFLVAFVLAWIVGTHQLMRRLIITILATSAVVIGFGLLQAFVLPADFLAQFGYNTSTILPYQGLTSGFAGLRFPSTLGGANQLATYIILPLCLALALANRRRWLFLLIPAGLIVLFDTYSRSGWIGAAIALVITLILTVPKTWRRPVAVIGGVLAIIVAIAVGLLVARGGSLQYVILHSSLATHDVKGSDQQHAESLRNGLSQVLSLPLGHGLGTAGPATFHTGAGNIIEDYYLQLGYELGIIGLIAFAVIVVLLAWRLLVIGGPAAVAVAATIIGISVTALVLPAWTDSSTALIVWTFAGAVLGREGEVQRV